MTASKPIIIFDFDGTLVDSMSPVIDYLFDTVLPQKNIKGFQKKDLPQLQNLSIGQLMWQIKWQAWQFPAIIKEIKKYQKDNLQKVEVFPGIKNLLENLAAADYEMMILTSNEEENVRAVLDSFQLTKYFSLIRTSHGIFNKPKSLRKIINDRQINAADILYVGDEIRDIKACHQAGVKIISVTYGFNALDGLCRYQPTYLASTPAQIQEIIFSHS